MKRKIAAFLITFAMLVCTYGTIPMVLKLDDNGAPKAEYGVLDISNWRFAEDGIIKLDGQWEFYPNQLLSAQNFAEGSVSSLQMIAVPGSWSDRMDTFGSATYRLRIYNDAEQRMYGLKTLSIPMANHVFVNGQSIGSSGNPSDDRSYDGRNKPFAGFFTLQPGTNEVIVQVSNYDFPASSGIIHSIYLGYADQIGKLQSKAIAYDWIRLTAFIMVGLYFIGLYIQRRKDTSVLMFGFICLFIGTFTAYRGERVVYELIDFMPGWLFLRIQYMSVIAAGMSLSLYVYTAYRLFCSKRVIRFMLGLGCIMLIGYALFFSYFQHIALQPVTTFYGVFPIFYALYVFVLAALHKVEGSLYLAAAAVSLNLYAFVQNLNIYFFVPLFTFPPVEPFMFLLMLTLLMSLRFSNAFKQNEELSFQLIQADKLKDEFLTKTAHEFKTPLHGMMNIAQSVLEDHRYPLTVEQKENIGIITTVAKRLSMLVYDILDFSKLKQGEMTVNPVPIHARSAIEVILKIFVFMTGGKPVQLINSVPQNLPFVFADPSRFRQIISNLLDNAVKYTEYGTIEVGAAEKDGMIVIFVKDTGIGIDEQDLSVIFEPFKSLKVDSNQSFGLGLPIVKQLLELQHGEIHVTSVKGEGTVFTMSLPSAGGSTEGENPENRGGEIESSELRNPVEHGYSFVTPYVSESKGTFTILVVDDQFSNLKVLIDPLERLNYTVIAVKSGEEALQQMEGGHSIDLVILDLMLPGLSGFDVVREIRRKYSLLELPVLMVTASIQPEDKIVAFESGANDYLPKPFNVAELKARVKSLLIMKESVGKTVDLEVAFLQSQIKPHFLFNVLNTIMALSYTDVMKSRKLITDLADYLRGSFSFSNIQKGVPFSNELALIQSYVEIEKARFKDRIQIEYEISEAVQSVMLPPLLIQPLVENAIRHGIGSRLKGGVVRIKGYEAEGHYWFEVEDNGVGLEQERLRQVLMPDPGTQLTSRSSVGLQNISKRLKFMYGTDLSIESEIGIGTKVTLRVPFGS
ncbi:ATP-binding protein [Paenibacillus radicis (ex Xue et al. 2023)]|uniref:histidine kinase n=1 Tax=Paenibacillus radicis (ex Xue et al. 2023) TaxID=2972489 RepID=A0ABT1YTG2_9BACL|nr:ATP-binding protein [Paenibacillus radicis (ex Xue et al. 2023)]MCR8636475.1 ATP-binding protein [Paenibacillus radicis (ex Xue et al. 2023)]